MTDDIAGVTFHCIEFPCSILSVSCSEESEPDERRSSTSGDYLLKGEVSLADIEVSHLSPDLILQLVLWPVVPYCVVFVFNLHMCSQSPKIFASTDL